jgi:hypothetical protein
MGALLLWYPLFATAQARGWIAASFWPAVFWSFAVFISATLGLALVLTVYSMLDYLWSYRSLVGMRD